jgi:hypothetical protein
MVASSLRVFRLVALTAGNAAGPSDGMADLFIDAEQHGESGASPLRLLFK